MAGGDILEARALVKRYGGVAAVDGLSFTVRKGEVFALLGPNGAGKTTTIKMLCGLLEPSSGSISIAAGCAEGAAAGKGATAGNGARRASIGLCPQDIVVWDNLSCLEQLLFMAEMYDVRKGPAKARALSLLHTMGLTEKKDSLAKTLSGGMKRRLNIILALVHDPAIVVLDEPQAGLDPQSRVLVRDYIRSLKDERTVILTTHDMEEADKLADRVAIIDRGRLLVLDTPARLKESGGGTEIIELEAGEADRGALAAMAEALSGEGFELSLAQGELRLAAPDVLSAVAALSKAAAGAGVVIGELRIRRRSLEDVFMALTGRGLRE
ncbi:MAG TPA: ABC transporter ATP-binding protein [Rectinemataceae bacterium]|nr:ABC transporter ATP-binding protein [Rectinemataceae bacterium]